MNQIKQRIKNWSDDLGLLDGHSRLEYLVDLAKQSTTMSPEKRIDERLVSGCISKIWVDVQVNDNQVTVEYDSDAMITKGITRIVCECVNGSTVEDCKEIVPDDFMDLGFQQLLSAQRRNGLGNLISTILTRFNTLASNQNS